MCVVFGFSQRLLCLDLGNQRRKFWPFSPRNSLWLDIVSVYTFYTTQIVLDLVIVSLHASDPRSQFYRLTSSERAYASEEAIVTHSITQPQVLI